MKLCIIGWYGTETLGDRAILGGIFRIISKLDKSNCYAIGSIYPFYTQRTLDEEKEYYNNLAEGSNIYCFDVKDRYRFREEIENADMLVMGGGPLMDLYEMELIMNAFRYGHKKGKKTILMGCGADVRHPRFKRMVYQIMRYCSMIIVRDDEAKSTLEEIWRKYSAKLLMVHVCGDPAILGVDLKYRTEEKEDFAVVNLRDVSFDYSIEQCNYISRQMIRNLEELAKRVKRVYLMPNHTFFKGGDDRKYYLDIIDSLDSSKFVIINKPLNLSETFSYIAKARICVGMRYHAILFQTLLNGNNYICDYTDEKGGKIRAFLNSLPDAAFYRNRYTNLRDENIRVFDYLDVESYGESIESVQADIMDKYINEMKEL